MDDQYDSESLSSRFVSLDASLPSLQVIASSAVALPIFYNVISRHNLENLKKRTKAKFIELENRLLAESDEMAVLLKTPKSIEEFIQRSLKKLYDELLKCLHYFQYGLFYGSLESRAGNMLSLNPHYCVWHSNGTIDYQNTTLNILPKMPVSRSDVVRKFIVMSNFCMEDELRTFDLTSLPKNFSKKVTLEQNCLVYYWIRRLRNELHKIPLRNFHSIDAEMALKCLKIPDLWMMRQMSFSLKPPNAFEYFWNRLDTEDRISVVRVWLDLSNRENGAYYDHRLGDILSMMSWHQQRCLLSEMADQVILNFCLNANSPDWTDDAAIWAWTHSKNLITTERFHTLVVDMLRKKGRSEEAMNVLIKIWQSAPNQLQNYVVEKASHQIASFVFIAVPSRSSSGPDDSSGISSYHANQHSTALKFLHSFLSSADVNLRKEIILSNAHRFAMYTGDHELLGEVLDLCLPNTKDQSDFKTSVVNSITMNRTNKVLMNDLKIDILKIRLKFYSVPDSKACQENMKLLLLKSRFHLKGYFVRNEKAWNELSGLINDMYSSDETSVLEFKKMFITSLVTDWDRSKRFGFEYEWENTLNVLVSVFKNDDLKNFKQMFLENLARFYVDKYWQSYHFLVGEFYEFFKINFVKVVPWCLDEDEDAIREFKNVHVPVDVFYKQVINHLCMMYEDLFPKVDEILKWYMSEELVKEYKSSGTNIRDCLEISRQHWKRISYTGRERNLKKTVKWLFSGDGVAVGKFLKSINPQVSH